MGKIFFYQVCWAIWKKIPFFRSNDLGFFHYLKVDIYGSLSGQGADDKKPKISTIKAKIIYFEASMEKKSKILNFWKNFQFSNLNFFFLLFLIEIHSMQGWTLTTRHGVTRKRSTKILQHTGNLFRKNLQLKDVC